MKPWANRLGEKKKKAMNSFCSKGKSIVSVSVSWDNGVTQGEKVCRKPASREGERRDSFFLIKEKASRIQPEWKAQHDDGEKEGSDFAYSGRGGVAYHCFGEEISRISATGGKMRSPRERARGGQHSFRASAIGWSAPSRIRQSCGERGHAAA